VSKTLLPRQPGTLRLLREHGDALVCVRYRHDTSGLYRYTTVELIVDQWAHWRQPFWPPPVRGRHRPRRQENANDADGRGFDLGSRAADMVCQRHYSAQTQAVAACCAAAFGIATHAHPSSHLSIRGHKWTKVDMGWMRENTLPLGVAIKVYSASLHA
jgi:hypothetical protein